MSKHKIVFDKSAPNAPKYGTYYPRPEPDTKSDDPDNQLTKAQIEGITRRIQSMITYFIIFCIFSIN